MGFDPLVETGLDSTKVGDRGDYQVCRERGRTEKERKARVEVRKLITIDGHQGREKDGIELNEK